MKFLAATLLASAALAAPIEKRAVTDADILQYALTLEHLENVFYKKAITSFPEQAFLDAGFSAKFYSDLKYIAHDEEEHVKLLTSALSAAGAMPVAACEYDFPFTDVKSFVTLSSVLEGVGTSAYLGGAGLISSKDYLNVAGSILVTEALHTSLTRFNIGKVAAANPYGTGLGINEVYTLAAAFIKSCPSTNAALPVMAFPALTAMQGTPTSPGLDFAFSVKDMPEGEFFVTFISGLDVVSSPARMSEGTIVAAVPMVSQGQTYAVLTSKSVKALTDDVVLAGPAIIEVTPPSPTFDVSQS